MGKIKEKSIKIRQVVVLGKTYLLKEDVEKYLETFGIKLREASS